MRFTEYIEAMWNVVLAGGYEEYKFSSTEERMMGQYLRGLTASTLEDFEVPLETRDGSNFPAQDRVSLESLGILSGDSWFFYPDDFDGVDERTMAFYGMFLGHLHGLLWNDYLLKGYFDRIERKLDIILAQDKS